MIKFQRLVKLTKWEYYADFLITAPATLGLLILSVIHGVSLKWFGEAGIGLFVWSLYEYVVHRWVLHEAPLLLRRFHAMHHDEPRDYIALHPLLTTLMYAGSWLAFGLQSSAAMIGFSIGYVVYAALHTLFHYADIRRGHPLWRLKRRHAIHHAVDDTNYGVVTSLWDRVFGTEF